MIVVGCICGGVGEAFVVCVCGAIVVGWAKKIAHRVRCRCSCHQHVCKDSSETKGKDNQGGD